MSNTTRSKTYSFFKRPANCRAKKQHALAMEQLGSRASNRVKSELSRIKDDWSDMQFSNDVRQGAGE